MEDEVQSDAQRYYWYVRGCEQLGWLPLMKADFLRFYTRRQRCEQVVCEYRQKREDDEFWMQQGFDDTLRIDKMLGSLREEITRLSGIEQAVLAGRRLDEDGGAGVGARLDVLPPTLEPIPLGRVLKIPVWARQASCGRECKAYWDRLLTGTAARQLPYLETEPDVRHPWPE